MWLGKEECNVTWENESATPRSALQEFEDDSSVEEEKLSTEKIGQMSHMLSVHPILIAKNKNQEQKAERIVVDSNNG